MPVGRRLGVLFRQQLHHHNLLPRAFSLSPSRQSRAYSRPPPSNRKLNLPIDFNASCLLAHSSATALANPELPGDVRASTTTKKMNYFQAVNDALAAILEEDERACIFGEDVAFGGVFRCTTSLSDRFGSQRVFNTPLTEQGIIGFAIGLAAQGHTALPEIQFADYMFPAFDQLHNEASKYRYRAGGAKSFTSGHLVVRMPTGAVGHGALYHSQSPEGFFSGCQGLKVVIPRGPIQAKGLLLEAAQGAHDPVIFMEPKILYRAAVEQVPTAPYRLPIGKAEILKEGKDLTIISYGTMVYICEAAIKHIEKELGVTVELIDLRTIRPWDKKTVEGSVNKTGRCIVVHEASRTGGVGEGVASEVAERCFLRLEAPVCRVTGFDTHVPLAFESFLMPDVAKVFDGAKKTLEY
ncbi:thiamine diphosphate-binding protein [Terfezia boudieri ATCC MYA-4762]|uniref:3-methyl-2-oxobutanoate dehydrogenase (2-methylpropanoyl-transferring) n=1 Tax=Terfezia boudieri ATCC MYA-4762 TaxID=1051890 RepID=A0A3N4LQ07_9PEZI|nr:thiamine diphosphate-binding protein [Terfezia boudieri ATCC MYA-4762]